MEKITISLFKQRKNSRLIGLKVYNDEGKEEIQKVIEVIYDSLVNNFPGVKIIKYGKAKEIILD
jgi:hypothetical protein